MTTVEKSEKKSKLGGKRPGSGRPKGVPNRATAEQRINVSEMAKQFAKDALDALVFVATQGQSESARVAAANSLLDRGFGKAPQSMELTGKDGKDLVPDSPKGVLVVPGVMDEQAWEKMMAKHKEAT